jgi:hypothetical protein
MGILASARPETAEVRAASEWPYSLIWFDRLTTSGGDSARNELNTFKRPLTLSLSKGVSGE